nr:4'-phosphopantetheinyl transferase superfamily protein [Rubellimicrobium arenae]
MNIMEPPLSAGLLAQAREALGPSIAVAGGRVSDCQGPLLEGEASAISRAVRRRQEEFVAGRTAARQAMADLGLLPRSLPRRPDGPPAWPEGVTGSITHAGGQVLAAVGRLGPGLRAIGLDLEEDVSLPGDLVHEVCRPDEDQSRAIRIFSAKEAVYKAQYMLSRQPLEFADLRLEIAMTGEFSAEFMRPAPGFSSGQRLAGRQMAIGRFVLSAVIVRC